MCRNRVNVYCGFLRATIVKNSPKIIDGIVFQIPCTECYGTGIFDCGIDAERGTCVCCKGTGRQFIGI